MKKQKLFTERQEKQIWMNNINEYLYKANLITKEEYLAMQRTISKM